MALTLLLSMFSFIGFADDSNTVQYNGINAQISLEAMNHKDNSTKYVLGDTVDVTAYVTLPSDGMISAFAVSIPYDTTVFDASKSSLTGAITTGETVGKPSGQAGSEGTVTVAKCGWEPGKDAPTEKAESYIHCKAGVKVKLFTLSLVINKDNVAATITPKDVTPYTAVTDGTFVQVKQADGTFKDEPDPKHYTTNNPTGASISIGKPTVTQIDAVAGTTTKIDQTRNYIAGIEVRNPVTYKSTNTVANVRKVLDGHGGTIVFMMKDASGNYKQVTDETALVGTGTEIILKDASGTTIKTYELCIYGDINGDGYLDTGDSLALTKHCTKKKILSGVYKLACDVNHDGYFDTGDSLRLTKHLTKKATIDQNVL